MAYVQPSTNIVLIKNCILQKSVNDETDTLYFKTKELQTAYFNGLGNKVEYSPTTYQNISQGVMRIGKTMKQLYGCNYMYFTNSGSYTDDNNATVYVGENKRYYCFIDRLKYINNNCTEVYYSIDYIQTFMFDYDEKTCFVERMTTDDDDIGKYLLDEGLDLGKELVVSSCNRKQFDGDWYYAIVFASKTSFTSGAVYDMQRQVTDKQGVLVGSQTLSDEVTGQAHDVTTAKEFWEMMYEDVSTQLDGKMQVPLYINTGVTIYPVVNVMDPANFNSPIIDTNSGVSHRFSTSNEYMTKLYGTESPFNNTDYTRLMESIVNVALYPNFFTTGSGDTVSYSGMGTIQTASDTTLDYPTNLNGYTPKNKKLLTFPYISLTVTNPNGDSINLRYELFNNHNAVTFKLECTVLPSVQCLLSPVDYSGYLGHIDSSSQQSQSDKVARDIGLVITDFPKVPIYTDSYREYLGKNKYREFFSIVNALTSTGFGVGTAVLTGGATLPGLIGEVSSTYKAIEEQVTRHYEASFKPPGLVGQMGTSDIKLGKLMFGYTFLGMSIDYEHAKVIDDYFTRYGYKLARNEKPSRNNHEHRKNFTFIKTIECNLAINQHNDTFTGYTMSQEDEKAIEAIYNNGVRFWYGTDGNGRRYYKDYSVNNQIVPTQSNNNQSNNNSSGNN